MIFVSRVCNVVCFYINVIGDPDERINFKSRLNYNMNLNCRYLLHVGLMRFYH